MRKKVEATAVCPFHYIMFHFMKTQPLVS